MTLRSFETMDPNLLLGLVNTALRNDYDSLHDLVRSQDLDEDLLRERLKSIGMVYYPDINQFRAAGL